MPLFSANAYYILTSMSPDKMSSLNTVKPLPRHTLEGGFSQHFAYEDEDGKTLLRRRPLSRPAWEKIIKTNIEQWGFDKDGGQITIRTAEETQEFVERALQAGLRVLPVTPDGTGGSFTPYLESAMTLDAYLPTAPDEDAKRALEELLGDFLKAHEAGIVYGDRWYNNILVDPTLGVVNIDFDLKLAGPGKELDLAQAIFYTIALDRNRSPVTLVHLLKNCRNDYDFELIKKFVDTKERRSRKKYGDLSGIFQDLFEQIGADRTNLSL